MMIPAVVVILYLYLRVKHTYGGAFFYFTNDGIRLSAMSTLIERILMKTNKSPVVAIADGTLFPLASEPQGEDA